MANRAIIMRGCSGSGKTFYAQSHFPNAKFFSTDNFWIDEKTGEYKFNAKLIGEAHAWNLRRFVYEVTHNVDDGAILVVDNTNTTIAEFAPYYAIAAAYGFDTEIITLDVDYDVAYSRNTHKVPHVSVQSQRLNMMLNNGYIPKHWKHTLIKPGEDGFCK